MKIVITNAYTWYNKGDAGILLGTIDVLKKIFKDAEFKVLSFTPEEDKKRYCKDSNVKDVKSNILNPHPYKHTKTGKIIAIIKLVIKLFCIQLNVKINFKKYKNKNEILKLLDKADIIVVCGGGFLGGKKIDSLMHLYQIYINTLFNKPVYIMGTSIEPINNIIVKNNTEKVLKKVDYIFAREEITYKYLQSFMPKNKFGLTPDMAFALKEEKHEFSFLSEINNDYMLFGITVRNWNFPNENKKNRKSLMNKYIEEIAKTITHFIENKKIIFVFVPQVIVSYANDIEVAYKIKERIPEEINNRFIIREDDWTPYEIKSLISNFDGFIGTRMHSNIFAASMNVPTLAIAYEKKTNGIMKCLNLEDFVIEINDIRYTELVKKIELMIHNKKEISTNLNKRIKDIKKEITKEARTHIKGV